MQAALMATALVLAQGGPVDGLPSSMLGTGILGVILGWLLFVYIPSRHKEFREIVTEFHRIIALKDQAADARSKEFDKIMDDTNKAYRDSLKENQIAFKLALDKLVDHCNEELKYLAERLGEPRPNKGRTP